MKLEGISLIAVDLDGTAMSQPGVVNAHTQAVLHSLVSAGFMVVLATGRPAHRLVEDIVHVDEIRYIISGDGSAIFDRQENRRIWSCPIPWQKAAGFVGRLMAFDGVVYIHCDDAEDMHVLSLKNYHDMFGEKYREFAKRPDFLHEDQLDNWICTKHMNVMKVCLNFEIDSTLGIVQKVCAEEYPEIAAFDAGYNTLEFTSSKTSKGAALAHLCGMLGVSSKEVFAIGDSGNDIAMLEWAGKSCAMGNATDKVKQAADFVCQPNDVDGCAKILEELFLK